MRIEEDFVELYRERLRGDVEREVRGEAAEDVEDVEEVEEVKKVEQRVESSVEEGCELEERADSVVEERGKEVETEELRERMAMLAKDVDELKAMRRTEDLSTEECVKSALHKLLNIVWFPAPLASISFRAVCTQGNCP